MSQPPLQSTSLLRKVLTFVGGDAPVYRERSIWAALRLLVVVSFYYAICSGLFAYWPAWKAGYQAYFRGFGNAAFEQFLVWQFASVQFLDLNARDIIAQIRAAAPPLTLPDSFPVPHRDKVKDTLLLLKSVDPQRPGLGQLRTGSRFMAYWPTTTIVALALATPWVWRRRIWVLGWSFVLIHAFIVFRLALFAFKGGFADPEKDYRLVDLSQATFERIKRLDVVINDNPTTHFIAPVLIWLAIVVGMEAWSAARRKFAGSFRLPARRRRDPMLESAGRGRRRTRTR